MVQSPLLQNQGQQEICWHIIKWEDNTWQICQGASAALIKVVTFLWTLYMVGKKCSEGRCCCKKVPAGGSGRARPARLNSELC